MRLEAMAVEFPTVAGHPNRVPFAGVLTLVDVPSDKAPSGSRGHRVVLTRSAAEAALPSLLGMAVDFKTGWDGHDAKQKCGIVTAAGIEGNELHVEGYLFARDYAEMMREMEAHGDEVLGMSYELADAHVEDMRASEWRHEQGDVYGCGDSAAQQGGVPADELQDCEASHGGCGEA